MLERKEPFQQITPLILDINPGVSRLIISINMILFIICFGGKGKNLLRCSKTAELKKATNVTKLIFFLLSLLFILLERMRIFLISLSSVFVLFFLRKKEEDLNINSLPKVLIDAENLETVFFISS